MTCGAWVGRERWGATCKVAVDDREDFSGGELLAIGDDTSISRDTLLARERLGVLEDRVVCTAVYMGVTEGHCPSTIGVVLMGKEFTEEGDRWEVAGV